ncbi:MAG: tRNA lysidine(34) synthetase TilS [Phycisphaerales bacterium]|nr:MAG: tRNA lysidine(34) synthetase TilS [Phycisphaerales bacterium]
MCNRMLSEFERKVADFVKANGLVGSAQKLLLAVSGGADSTALIHTMHTLKAAGIFKCELLCAHLNHQLRGSDADLDEEFVAARTAKLKLPLITRSLDVRGHARREKLSIETAARELRIRALSRIAKANNCHAIVTAHQKNDNAETICQRLARGTGFRGLAGIWPARIFSDGTKFIRPLLCVGRDEIVEYLQRRNLQWRHDRTNADCSYRRNFIRHCLLPELQRNSNHSIVERLSELAKSAREFYGAICARVDELWKDVADCTGDEVALDVEVFLIQAPPVKIELVRRSLAHIGCGERDLTQGHYENVLQLAEQSVTGGKIDLPGAFAVCRGYGSLVFSSDQKRLVGQVPPYVDNRDRQSVALNLMGKTRFDKYLIEAEILDVDSSELEQFTASKTDYAEWFDLDRIKAPLTVRLRRSGDRFIPLGMKSHKKLGKFLTAHRVPHRLRNEVLVVADAEKIIWVCPLRISEQARVTNRTRTVLQLQISDLEDRQNSVDCCRAGQIDRMHTVER